MYKEYYLNTIEHIIEIGKSLPNYWFRGHEEKIGLLTPRVYRHDEMPQKEDTEYILFEMFRRYAPSLAQNLPRRDDHLSWLILMQHHGVPTRLLDWSESVLIAAYFATKETKGKTQCDGELWAMNPKALNQIHKSQNLQGIATFDNDAVKSLSGEFLLNKGKDRRNHYEKEFGKIPEYPVAFQSPMNFPRLTSQLSTFTIHPTESDKNTITETLSGEDSLVRYIIEAKYKRQIFRDLSMLGINRRIIFQDLDSLASDLVQEIKIKAELSELSQRPPTCGGQYRP